MPHVGQEEKPLHQIPESGHSVLGDRLIFFVDCIIFIIRKTKAFKAQSEYCRLRSKERQELVGSRVKACKEQPC